jgi:2-polyprenyl-3-methyl-5-hydroxy-6-metoxy-1,4-benzoquinol methylase
MWYKQHWQRLRYALTDPRVRLIRATRRVVKTGRLLDVGCGGGEVLALARKYYDCVGIEPSCRAAATTRSRHIPVIESTFEQAEIEPHSFDEVILDSVIEHVQSPREVLEKVNSILRMQGVVVLKTPKFGGPAYRRHGAGWNGFRHGYHTFLFTGGTLGKFLNGAGFEVLRAPRRDRMLDDILILWGRKTSEQQVGDDGLVRKVA